MAVSAAPGLLRGGGPGVLNSSCSSAARGGGGSRGGAPHSVPEEYDEVEIGSLASQDGPAHRRRSANGLLSLSSEDKARIGQLIKVLAQERRDKEAAKGELTAQRAKVEDLERERESSKQRERAMVLRMNRSLCLLREYQRELYSARARSASPTMSRRLDPSLKSEHAETATMKPVRAKDITHPKSLTSSWPQRAFRAHRGVPPSGSSASPKSPARGRSRSRSRSRSPVQVENDSSSQGHQLPDLHSHAVRKSSPRTASMDLWDHRPVRPSSPRQASVHSSVSSRGVPRFPPPPVPSPPSLSSRPNPPSASSIQPPSRHIVTLAVPTPKFLDDPGRVHQQHQGGHSSPSPPRRGPPSQSSPTLRRPSPLRTLEQHWATAGTELSSSSPTTASVPSAPDLPVAAASSRKRSGSSGRKHQKSERRDQGKSKCGAAGVLQPAQLSLLQRYLTIQQGSSQSAVNRTMAAAAAAAAAAPAAAPAAAAAASAEEDQRSSSAERRRRRVGSSDVAADPVRLAQQPQQPQQLSQRLSQQRLRLGERSQSRDVSPARPAPAAAQPSPEWQQLYAQQEAAQPLSPPRVAATPAQQHRSAKEWGSGSNLNELMHQYKALRDGQQAAMTASFSSVREPPAPAPLPRLGAASVVEASRRQDDPGDDSALPPQEMTVPMPFAVRRQAASPPSPPHSVPFQRECRSPSPDAVPRRHQGPTTASFMDHSPPQIGAGAAAAAAATAARSALASPPPPPSLFWRSPASLERSRRQCEEDNRRPDLATRQLFSFNSEFGELDCRGGGGEPAAAATDVGSLQSQPMSARFGFQGPEHDKAEPPVQSAWWSTPLPASVSELPAETRGRRGQENVEAGNCFPKEEAVPDVRQCRCSASFAACEASTTGDFLAQPQKRRQREGRGRSPSPPLPMWANVHARPPSEARGGSRNSPVLRLSSPAASTGSQGQWSSCPAVIPMPALLSNSQGQKGATRTPPRSPQPLRMSSPSSARAFVQATSSPSTGRRQSFTKARRNASPSSRQQSRSPSVVSWPGQLHDGYYAPSMFDLLDSVESAISAWPGGSLRERHAAQPAGRRSRTEEHPHPQAAPPRSNFSSFASPLSSQDVPPVKPPPARYREHREHAGKPVFGSIGEVSPASSGRHHKREVHSRRARREGRPVRQFSNRDTHRLAAQSPAMQPHDDSLQEVDDILSLMPWWMS